MLLFSISISQKRKKIIKKEHENREWAKI